MTFFSFRLVILYLKLLNLYIFSTMSSILQPSFQRKNSKLPILSANNPWGWLHSSSLKSAGLILVLNSNLPFPGLVLLSQPN